MISVDTNVVVRLLTGDDPVQFQRVQSLFQADDIFIATTVVLETEWVLRYAYRFSPPEICEALQFLFGLPNVHIEEPQYMAQALAWHRQEMDFADAVHLAKSGLADSFVTFDKKLIRKAAAIVDLPVSEP